MSPEALRSSSSLVNTVRRFTDLFLIQKKKARAATQRTNMPVKAPAIAPTTVGLRPLPDTESNIRKRRKRRRGGGRLVE